MIGILFSKFLVSLSSWSDIAHDRFAYTQLLQRIPQTPSDLKSGTDAETGWPKKSDFTQDELDTMFWSRSSWTKYCNETEIEKGNRGRSQAVDGINVKMLYVVNRDGEPIDGHLAAKMRRVAWEFWKGLSIAGAAPKKWMTNVDLETAKRFRLEMQTQFEDLRLCDGGWKVDQIAIDYYSGWRKSQVDNGIFNKENTPIIVSDGEEDTSNANRPRNDQTPSKRKAKGNQSDQVPAAKKQKKEATKPAVVDKCKAKAKAKPVQIKDPLYVFIVIPNLMLKIRSASVSVTPMQETVDRPRPIPTKAGPSTGAAVGITPTVVAEPALKPVTEPTIKPTVEPVVEPTIEPVAKPALKPVAEPVVEPTIKPTIKPVVEPAVEPVAEPAVEPAVAVEPVAPINASEAPPLPRMIKLRIHPPKGPQTNAVEPPPEMKKGRPGKPAKADPKSLTARYPHTAQTCSRR